MQCNPISDEHFNSVQTHLSSKVRKYDLTVLELDPKESVRESLIDYSVRLFSLCHMILRAAEYQLLVAPSNRLAP